MINTKVLRIPGNSARKLDGMYRIVALYGDGSDMDTEHVVLRDCRGYVIETTCRWPSSLCGWDQVEVKGDTGYVHEEKPIAA